MARMITLAAAQTGPVLTDDWRDGVPGACRMIEQAARKQADIVCFAEILFMPICAATYGETKERGNTWELPLQARAYENGVYVVAVNRVGDEDGRKHIGKSMIVDPVGADVIAVASSDGPELLVASVDLDNVAKAQTSLPWWRDRRPELYGALGAVPG